MEQKPRERGRCDSYESHRPLFQIVYFTAFLIKSRLCVLKDYSSLSSISASCPGYPLTLLDPAGPVGP